MWILLLLISASHAAEFPGSAEWMAKPESFWKEKLSKEAFRVCRKEGTERAGSGEYDKFKGEGVYHCSSCGLPLFKSEHKYDSGTGWPSFWEVLDSKNVVLKEDRSWWGGSRTEVECARCGAHLGHVFDDGPQPTGKRYCMNSVCLKFEPVTKKAESKK
jgi:methionine-R-sulfoxide reductase